MNSVLARGYAHPLYAQALASFGTPRELPSSGGWILERSVPGTEKKDAMAPYPLFCCLHWEGLRDDLNALQRDLVSVVMVADPFGSFDEALLQQCFDCVTPFKTHFLVDFDKSPPLGTSHHRYRARRALRDVTVEICEPSERMLQEWIGLYNHLVQRHSLAGVQAFSGESFRKQFAVPGLVILRAANQTGECVGAQLWYVQGDVAFSHLTAANEHGYRLACLYAIYHAALQYFRGRVRFLDLGGSSGLSAASDGLAKFKEGWSNASRTVFLCGRILDRAAYEQLANCRSNATNYFPAYRCGQAV